MGKQKPKDEGSKQSAEGGSSSGPVKKPSAGKDAASHAKAGKDKGAGGGKKQARKH